MTPKCAFSVWHLPLLAYFVRQVLGVTYDMDDMEEIFDDVRMMYGYEADGGGREKNFWRWGFKMYQPSLEDQDAKKAWSPGYSRMATGQPSVVGSSADDSFADEHQPDRRPDSATMQGDVMRLYKVPPTRKHHDMIRCSPDCAPHGEDTHPNGLA